MAASCKIETADRVPVAVPVSSICKYVNKACERSPCLRDGEAAYEAGDVIECSVEAIRGGRVNIHARVLHPSGPLSPPHRVAVTLERNDVTEALCTCKAGSYKCGHVVAVLLHLHARQLLAQPSVQCQGPHVSVKKEKQNKKNEPKETLDLPRIDKLTIDDAPGVAGDISRRPLQNRLHKSTSPVPTKHAPESPDWKRGGGSGGPPSDASSSEEPSGSSGSPAPASSATEDGARCDDSDRSPSPDQPLALDTRSSQRRSPLDTLARLFPTRPQSTLAAVLDRCGGDVLQALDHLLLQEPPPPPPPLDYRRHPPPPPPPVTAAATLLGAVPAYPGLFPPPPPPPASSAAAAAEHAKRLATLWSPQQADHHKSAAD